MSEWITHDGGPCPVGLGDFVWLRMRDGYEITEPRMANRFDWSHNTPDPETEIIAYRLAQSEPAATCIHGLSPRACGRCSDIAKPEPAAISERAIHWDAAKRIPLARDMTKRERFAMAAMQGWLANPGIIGEPTEGTAEWACHMADALLAALEAK